MFDITDARCNHEVYKTSGYQSGVFEAYRPGNIITCYVADEDKYFWQHVASIIRVTDCSSLKNEAVLSYRSLSKLLITLGHNPEKGNLL